MNAEQLQTFASEASQAAKLGGQQLLQFMGKISVTLKGPRDLVTEADFASQKVIREHLLGCFPDHQFLGEESTGEEQGSFEEGYCWIVDPLDGTTNFVHQLPSFSVSIGLYHEGQPIVGVVWDPILEEMFVGIAGQGATLNGKPIGVSKCDQASDAMVVISLRKGVGRADDQINSFLTMLETVGTIRRLGSAALNLCYVAMGRVDTYWANGLQPWDMAAGALIAAEAGASIQTRDGEFSMESREFVCASCDELAEQIMAMLA